jgi:copper chaperone NosL
MSVRSFLIAVICWFSFLSVAVTAEINPQKPGEKDKCPVCGMFIHKYPDWVGEIIFADGAVVFFDGAKDLFKYFFDLQKYASSRTQKDIAAIFVTEYYDMNMIDARSAVFVIGSDIYGPMGHELIPFKSREEAEEFKKDHKGRDILTFDQVKPAVIDKLD